MITERRRMLPAIMATAMVLALAGSLSGCTTDLCITPRSAYSQKKTAKTAAAGTQTPATGGPEISPETIYAARTGEAKGASMVRMKLQFTLTSEAGAQTEFERGRGRIPEVVTFVTGAHTTGTLGTEAGRARLAQEIADNINQQSGKAVVASVRIVNITISPAN